MSAPSTFATSSLSLSLLLSPPPPSRSANFAANRLCGALAFVDDISAGARRPPGRSRECWRGHASTAAAPEQKIGGERHSAPHTSISDQLVGHEVGAMLARHVILHDGAPDVPQTLMISNRGRKQSPPPQAQAQSRLPVEAPRSLSAKSCPAASCNLLCALGPAAKKAVREKKHDLRVHPKTLLRERGFRFGFVYRCAGRRAVFVPWI